MKVLIAAVAAFLLALACTTANAQGSPAAPVRVLVPFPPGSPPDLFARAFSATLTRESGRPAWVENLPGAAGNLAAERLARAAPDGHTVAVLTEAQVVVNRSLYTLAYDPLKDLAPVSEVTRAPDVLVVGKGEPATSVRELVERARAHPGELTFASGGSGSTAHLAAELFKSSARIDIRHVPYKGMLAAAPDLLEGRVDLAFSPIPIVLPLVRDGKLRALAVTSPRRSPLLPGVPTIAEAGYPGVEMEGWNGVFVPAGTAAAVVGMLRDAAVKTLAQEEFRVRLENLALEPVGSAPQAFRSRIDADAARWARVIRDAGIKVD